MAILFGKTTLHGGGGWLVRASARQLLPRWGFRVPRHVCKFSLRFNQSRTNAHHRDNVRHGGGRGQGRGGFPCRVEPDHRAQRKLSQCRHLTDMSAIWDTVRPPDDLFFIQPSLRSLFNFIGPSWHDNNRKCIDYLTVLDTKDKFSPLDPVRTSAEGWLAWCSISLSWSKSV